MALTARDIRGIHATEADETCSTCPQVPAQFSKAETKARPSPSRQNREPVSWFEIQYLIRELARQLQGETFHCVIAISTGGIIPAKLIAEELGIRDIRLIYVDTAQARLQDLRLDRTLRYLVVDDIYDTGLTSNKVSSLLAGVDFRFAFCIARYAGYPGVCGRVLNHDRWIVFPWEKEQE